jgi:hypothetical protein
MESHVGRKAHNLLRRYSSISYRELRELRCLGHVDYIELKSTMKPSQKTIPLKNGPFFGENLTLLKELEDFRTSQVRAID